MPRPRQNASSSSSSQQLSPGQASYVLERLIADRRISPGEVNRYVSDMHREISDLEQRLQTLRTHAGGFGGGSGSSTGSSSTGRGAGSGSGSTGSGQTTGARRGRPPGSGRGPGRPPGSGRAASAGSSSGSTDGGGSGAGASARGGAKRRQRSAITPEQLASRQLQGRYLGLIRQIPASRRAQYQKLAKEKGREAAINEMQSTLRK